MKALITADLSDEAITRLKKIMEVKFGGYRVKKALPLFDELVREIGDTEVLIIEYEQITQEVIEKSTRLKIIACCRGNPVNVDIKSATKRGIPVIMARGRNAIAVSEFVFGLIIGLSRNIALTNYLLKKKILTVDLSTSDSKKSDKIWIGKNSPFELYKGLELNGKRLGIVGFGNIGRKVAKIALAFGMKVLVTDPIVSSTDIRQLGYSPLSLTELLHESDFVSLHCPPSKENERLIGKKELCLMKPSAFLINTSRGMVVDEKELFIALKEKRIAGAALDVFIDEPITSANPFLELDNVVVTPHIAGASLELNTHFSQFVVDDIINILEHRVPKNIANPEILPI